MAMGRPFDLPYSVEVWDDNDQHIEELVALTGDYSVAHLPTTRLSNVGPAEPSLSGRRRACWLTAGETDDEDLYQ